MGNIAFAALVILLVLVFRWLRRLGPPVRYLPNEERPKKKSIDIPPPGTV